MKSHEHVFLPTWLGHQETGFWEQRTLNAFPNCGNVCFLLFRKKKELTPVLLWPKDISLGMSHSESLAGCSRWPRPYVIPAMFLEFLMSILFCPLAGCGSPVGLCRWHAAKPSWQVPVDLCCDGCQLLPLPDSPYAIGSRLSTTSEVIGQWSLLWGSSPAVSTSGCPGPRLLDHFPVQVDVSLEMWLAERMAEASVVVSTWVLHTAWCWINEPNLIVWCAGSFNKV